MISAFPIIYFTKSVFYQFNLQPKNLIKCLNNSSNTLEMITKFDFIYLIKENDEDNLWFVYFAFNKNL